MLFSPNTDYVVPDVGRCSKESHEATMLALKIETVSPALGWLLFIHAMVDHGLTQE